MLRVRVLGRLALEIDGELIEAPASGRARALLGLLALRPGPQPRSLLAGRLRPDVDEDAARATLRQAASELRKALGDDGDRWLHADRRTLGFDPATVEVDLSQFRRLLSSGELESALELCRGSLLEGLDAEWVAEERRRHEADLDRLLASLAESAARAEDPARAVRLARRRVELDPLAEAPRRELIRLLAAGDDRAAALTEYERLRTVLRDELGLAPDAATRAVVERLLEEPPPSTGGIEGERSPEDPAAQHEAADRPLPGPLRRLHRSPFVGRDEELRRLESEWEGARGGEVRLALIGGEPGIGKSRLCAELGRRVHEEGAAVLFGRCYEEALMPYQPFAEALPALAQRLSELRGDLEQSPDGARGRLFEVVTTLLQRDREGLPGLLLLEDLHWADRGTALLLAHLARSEQLAPLMIVGTYRRAETPPDHPLAEAVADVRRDLLVTLIRLDGLGAADVGEIAAAWEGPAELVHRLTAETAGNPFFVEEMLRHLSESGSAGVPEGVREVIAQRLARLGRDTQRVLEAAAVLGEEFRLDVLETWAPISEGVADPLDRASVAGLLRAEDAPGHYAFAHALVRKAVYEALGPAQKIELHRQAAAALERLGADRRPAELAHHLAASAVSPAEAARAAEVSLSAGERAMDQLAYESAAVHFERALTLLERAGEDEARNACLARIELGDALLRSSGMPAAREHFERAGEIAEQLGDSELLARAALGRSGIGVTIIEVDERTVGLLEAAAEAVGDRSPGLAARVLARLAVELYYSPDRERSPALSSAAVELARRSGEDATLAFALNSRHVAMWRPDGLEERIEAAVEMREAACRAGDREAELQAVHWIALDAFEQGQVDVFEREAAVHDRLARELRLPGFIWYGPLWEASLACFRGQFDRVEEPLERALELGRTAGDENAELFHALVRAQMLAMMGRVEELDREFARQKAADSPAAHAYLAYLAWAEAASGDIDAAAAELARIGVARLDSLPRDANFIPTLSDATEAVSLIGDREWAAELYRLALPLERTNLVYARGAGSWGSGARLLGQLGLVLDRVDEATRHFELAVELEGRMGSEPFLARAQVGLAEALIRRGAPEDAGLAAEAARAAADAARTMGIAGVPDRAERVLAAVE